LCSGTGKASKLSTEFGKWLHIWVGRSSAKLMSL
jgi:hypothetical protein